MTSDDVDDGLADAIARAIDAYSDAHPATVTVAGIGRAFDHVMDGLARATDALPADDKVVPIRGAALTAGQPLTNPDPDVVDKLESLLRHARSGNLRAVAFATLNAAGVPANGWSIPLGINSHMVVASVLYLLLRLGAAGDDEPAPSPGPVDA